MPWHTVVQGEWIGSIAQQYKFTDWNPIWNHANNANLRQSRPNPQLLYPGDNVFVPDLDPGSVSCATDQVYTFQLNPATSQLIIIVKDENDQPIASKPYKLTFSDKAYTGTTDANGKLQEQIPVNEQTGTLEVDGYNYDVQVGHLDPIEELMGVQKRLTNLGYDCSPLDGNMNDKTTQAISQFQSEMSLPVTGQLDATTTSKLKEKYGC